MNEANEAYGEDEKFFSLGRRQALNEVNEKPPEAIDIKIDIVVADLIEEWTNSFLMGLCLARFLGYG